MKKIFTLTFGLLLTISATQLVSAQVYSYNTPYYNNSQSYCGNYGYYNCGNQTAASYYYTSGCYTYYYNGHTRTTSTISYNCRSQQTYTYIQPTTYTYYTTPYYTYSYQRDSGSWYPSYYNTTNTGYNNTYYYGNYDYGYNNYNDGFVYTPSVNCYYQGSYQICQ